MSVPLPELLAEAHHLSDGQNKGIDLQYSDIGELLEAHSGKYGRKPYLIYYDTSGSRSEYSYTEFFELCRKCANVLQSHGLERGDRIVTISHNHADTVVQYFGAWLLGVCVVPISLSEDDNRVRYIVENSRAKLAFLHADYVERISPILAEVSTLQSTIVCGKKDGSIHALHLTFFDSELANADSQFISTQKISSNDDALIVYTSGTTGNPKGVVLSHYNLLVDALAISQWHGLTAEQKMMCVLPIHHVNGTVVTLVTPMFFGGTVILNQKFQSEHFFERIHDEGVNVVSVVPTLLAFLLEHYKERPLPDFSPLRHIICGAGPLTVELAEQFEQKFGIPIVHGYGLSETTCYSCFLPADLSEKEHRHWMRGFGFPSIGQALPINEMMIADETGHELAPKEKGEIAIRGYNVMKYYYENERANEQTFSYGWFRSGDEGFYELDEQGNKYFFITGRLKELIIRGGVNISPLEIDEVIARCPGVKAGIAVGFENDFYGEEIGAYVQCIEGSPICEEDILAFCRKNLPHSKTPKVVIIGNDIPVTSTGKYQRNKCKPLFKEWRAVQFRKP